MALDAEEQSWIDITVRKLTAAPEFQQLRDFYTGEASKQDPDFDNLSGYVIGRFALVLDEERLNALHRYGKS